MQTKSREEFFLELAKFRLDKMEAEEISDLIEEYDCEKGSQLESFAAVLQEMYSVVTNGFLTDVFEMLCGADHEFEGESANLYACPCCGYKTLEEIHDVEAGTGYEICPVCGWEDDGTKSIDEERSINRGSIADYRKKMLANRNYYFREKYQK